MTTLLEKQNGAIDWTSTGDIQELYRRTDGRGEDGAELLI